ncbi:hypothetical protein FIU85_21115 (plasmid) [Roseovarius sp. THAF8]|uniref:hypothetical protein n=1 Tax=Roseovarius sp. THAF8 TaxID=2587846 RepID=UPI00126910A0|nr:hypothetical protein [Roseovarius sp. THAF8]QFT99833.1 hypothetical protein FIU85_21115 [Roseovarius sp. THAF8]
MKKQPPLRGFEELFASEEPSSCSEDLRNFPNLSRDTLTRNAKFFGLAGEYFVDSILFRFGHHTSGLAEMLPVDRMVYCSNNVLRLQVKTACRPRNGYFHFNLKKGYHGSPSGVRNYEPGDFDLVALVALSENVVKFTADRHQSHRIALSEIEKLRARPCASFEHAVADLGLLDASAATNTLGGQR